MGDASGAAGSEQLSAAVGVLRFEDDASSLIHRLAAKYDCLIDEGEGLDRCLLLRWASLFPASHALAAVPKLV